MRTALVDAELDAATMADREGYSPRRDAGVVGLTGDALRAEIERDEGPAPIPGMMDSEPSLALEYGREKIGKTTRQLMLGAAWAVTAKNVFGIDTAGAFGKGRVLVISAEQQVKTVGRRLLASAKALGVDEATVFERTVVVARHRHMSSFDQSLLTLDPEGFDELQTLLKNGAEEEPFGLMILDSLSRLKPHGMDENSNSDMSDLLGHIAEISETNSVYVELIHHEGKASNHGARGASAIQAVPQVVRGLRVGHQPHTRLLSVKGNDVPSSCFVFDVGMDDDEIRPWELIGEVDDEESTPEPIVIVDHMQIGQSITVRRLATQALGKSSGAARRNAENALKRACGAGIVEYDESSRLYTRLS